MERIHQNINLPVPRVKDFEGVNKYIFDMQHAIKELLTGDIYVESNLSVNRDITIYQGTLVLYDTVWEDLRFPAAQIRFGGVAPASEQLYKSGVVASFASGADNHLYFTAQMPHAWKLGSTIYPHLHWTIPTDDGAKTVRWVLSYSWTSIHGTITDATPIGVTANVVATDVNKHLLTALPAIVGTDKELSSILLCTLERDVSEGTYGHPAYLLEIDFHYEIDTVGSREELAK